MRHGLLITALIVAPFLLPAAHASDSASFSTTLPCIVADQFFLGAGIDVPGCTFTQSGSVHVDACDAASCTLTVTLHTEGDGVPAGLHSLATTVDDDSALGQSTICSTLEPSTSSTVTCDTTAQVRILEPSTCRFFTVATSGEVDGRAAGAELLDTFRVCALATGPTIDHA